MPIPECFQESGSGNLDLVHITKLQMRGFNVCLHGFNNFRRARSQHQKPPGTHHQIGQKEIREDAIGRKRYWKERTFDGGTSNNRLEKSYNEIG